MQYLKISIYSGLVIWAAVALSIGYIMLAPTFNFSADYDLNYKYNYLIILAIQKILLFLAFIYLVKRVVKGDYKILITTIVSSAFFFVAVNNIFSSHGSLIKSIISFPITSVEYSIYALIAFFLFRPKNTAKPEIENNEENNSLIEEANSAFIRKDYSAAYNLFCLAEAKGELDSNSKMYKNLCKKRLT